MREKEREGGKEGETEGGRVRGREGIIIIINNLYTQTLPEKYVHISVPMIHIYIYIHMTHVSHSNQIQTF